MRGGGQTASPPGGKPPEGIQKAAKLGKTGAPEAYREHVVQKHAGKRERRQPRGTLTTGEDPKNHIRRTATPDEHCRTCCAKTCKKGGGSCSNGEGASKNQQYQIQCYSNCGITNSDSVV